MEGEGLEQAHRAEQPIIPLLSSVAHSITSSYLMNSFAGACLPWISHVSANR